MARAKTVKRRARARDEGARANGPTNEEALLSTVKKIELRNEKATALNNLMLAGNVTLERMEDEINAAFVASAQESFRNMLDYGKAAGARAWWSELLANPNDLQHRLRDSIDRGKYELAAFYALMLHTKVGSA